MHLRSLGKGAKRDHRVIQGQLFQERPGEGLVGDEPDGRSGEQLLPDDGLRLGNVFRGDELDGVAQTLGSGVAAVCAVSTGNQQNGLILHHPAKRPVLLRLHIGDVVVVQLPGGIQHLPVVFRTGLLAAEHPGDRRGGEPGFFRNIVDRGHDAACLSAFFVL